MLSFKFQCLFCNTCIKSIINLFSLILKIRIIYAYIYLIRVFSFFELNCYFETVFKCWAWKLLCKILKKNCAFSTAICFTQETSFLHSLNLKALLYISWEKKKINHKIRLLFFFIFVIQYGKECLFNAWKHTVWDISTALYKIHNKILSSV